MACSHRWWTLALSLGVVYSLAAVPVWAQPVCPALVTEQVSITLGWTPGVQDAGWLITRHLLEQQVDTGPWTKIADIPSEALTYTVEPLTPGHTYVWRLFGVGTMPGVQGELAALSPEAVWAEAPQQPPCATILEPTPPPSPPLTVTVLTQCPRPCVVLTWEMVPAGTAVRVERRRSPMPWRVVQEGVTPVPFVDATVQRGQTYCYRARITTATAWSAEQCVQVP